MNHQLDSLAHVNLGKSVYAMLREALAAGRYQPNDRLRIRELALQLGTSVTPVRDAMLQLVQEETLVLRSARDFRVPVLGVARYLEIRALRLELEGLGAFEAAQRIDAATLAELERLLQANEEAIARHDLPAALQCNQAFHLGLAQAAGMPTLKRFVDHLWMQTAPLIAAGYAAFTPDMRVGHHRAIITALRQRDGAAARRAIEQDILDGGTQMLAYVMRQERIHAGATQPDEEAHDAEHA
ncbi:GntR family transcriptional regulator [Janthinobacterium sp. GW460P]|uniref:GntR family transcriptional regulator n=1 Tax=unclassified Janthinobacterium TaxID=2610881 RepID=UPI000A32971B|nr:MULTISPECIES: GntR family transcriptional regulator [unclassified Janthinobacterium]MCC7702670.1 GntR family transcriptional regulator [Janthinobacterium sp. GW460P]MCC7708178.1 GntR family transcriptional regulator [Janthinobacterium sp. GW460W]